MRRDVDYDAISRRMELERIFIDDYSFITCDLGMLLLTIETHIEIVLY